MNTTILTFYVLIWPVMSALVLAALAWGVWRDFKVARRKGENMV